MPIDVSFPGRAFLGDSLVEQAVADGVRVFVPLLDGTDRVGMLAFTSEKWEEDDRRLARRFGGLLADVLVTKGMYTDRFFQARRRQPMSLPAEMQWALLPPLIMTSPQVALAGILEPAYDVAGDSFDCALNDDALHVAIVDAMGHGLDAAVMATESARGEVTHDDATVFLVEWRGGTADHLQTDPTSSQQSQHHRGTASESGIEAGTPYDPAR